MSSKPVDDKDEWGDFLGDWGKHLVKKYGFENVLGGNLERDFLATTINDNYSEVSV